MALRSEIAAAEAALLQQEQQMDEAERKVLIHFQWQGSWPATNETHKASI